MALSKFPQPAPPAIPSNRDTVSPEPPVGAEVALLKPVGAALPPVRRLVVLVPDLDLDETTLARQIWNLAAPRRLTVLYLGQAQTAAVEFHARRRLATLAALTRDEGVEVNTALAAEADWLGALRSRRQESDLIVCHAEQTASSWRGARPLGPVLCQALRLPVHQLEGFYAADPAPAPQPRARFLFWGGSVAVLAGTLLLSLVASTLLQSWPASALMLLAVAAECGLIGWWSRAIR